MVKPQRHRVEGKALQFHSVRNEAAVADDEEWFAQHPGRRYHVRRLLPGESPNNASTHIIIVVLASDLALCMPFYWHAQSRSEPPDDDAELGRMIELFECGEAAFVQDGRVLSLHDIPATLE